MKVKKVGNQEKHVNKNIDALSNTGLTTKHGSASATVNRKR